MLTIENVDKILNIGRGIYKIHSVKDFTNSYSFAVLDTDIIRYFRIDLTKERNENGKYELRYSPSRFIEVEDFMVKNPNQLVWVILNLVVKYRKPIKTKL